MDLGTGRYATAFKIVKDVKLNKTYTSLRFVKGILVGIS